MDDTDLQGRCQRLEAENQRLWKAMDELMRDQTKIEKREERTQKRLDVIEAWLAAEEDEEAGLKPPAEGSVE